MMRFLSWLVDPFRIEPKHVPHHTREPDPAFLQRMHDARCEGLTESRISIRQQHRLNRMSSNYYADDLFAGPPEPEDAR